MIEQEHAIKALKIILDLVDSVNRTGGLYFDANDDAPTSPAINPEWKDFGYIAEDIEDLLFDCGMDKRFSKTLVKSSKSELDKPSPASREWFVVGHDYTTDSEDNIWVETVVAADEGTAKIGAEKKRRFQFGCTFEEQPARLAVPIVASETINEKGENNE